MAVRRMLAIGWLLVGLSVVLGAAPVNAQVAPSQPQGCYPPPCGLQDVTTAGAGTDLDATHLVSGVREADGRSPVPLVAVGLLMVTTTLTTLCLRRRMAMAADSRTQAVHSASERYPLTRKVPERSLR